MNRKRTHASCPLPGDEGTQDVEVDAPPEEVDVIRQEARKEAQAKCDKNNADVHILYDTNIFQTL